MSESGAEQVKLGDWIQRGFELYKANLGAWLVAALLAVVISIATVGLLAGPMMAGLVWMALAQADRKAGLPQAGDVFKGFDYFLQALLFYVVWGVAVFVVTSILTRLFCVGPVLSLLLSVGVHTALMFAPFLIVDRKMEFWPASRTSFEKVKPAILPFAGFGIVTGFIGGIGAVACGVGLIVTLPLAVCILAVAYRDVFGEAARG